MDWYASIIKPQGIALYCALAKHANSKNQACWPSYETILKCSSIGKRNTVSKYLKILERHELIKIIRNNKREKNYYFLLMPKKPEVDSTLSDTSKKISDGTHKDSPQYQKGVPDSAKMDTLSLRMNNKKEINLLSTEEKPTNKGLRSIKDEMERLGLLLPKKDND
ncbi:MAG: helix-turn-helix domain-containing protein [bacterium]